MPCTVTGDFSRYPTSIQNVFPMLYGEAFELRQMYGIFFHLFMEKEQRTIIMSQKLGAILGSYQRLLQDELFLGIGRLTDKNSIGQENVGLSALLVATPEAKSPGFDKMAKAALVQIERSSSKIRKHRHKRIAHFDLDVSLSKSMLPTVTLGEIDHLISDIAAFVNLFAIEFADATIGFEVAGTDDFTIDAETTCYKAMAYDLLESEGTISKSEWKRRVSIELS